MDQILWDFSPVDTIQIVSESKTSGEMIIRGVFGRANEVNNNKRIYPKAILEREVVKLQPLINESRLLGELEHPERVNVSLTNASHLITKLHWNGNVLLGEAKILNTPSGKIAQQLIKDGVKLGVSSRGTGTLKESQAHPGVSEVTDSYRMLTFDLVADPSTRGAFPSLVSESTKVALEKSKKEVATQNLLTKLFESKLEEVREDRINKLFEGSSSQQRMFRKLDSKWKKSVKNKYDGSYGKSQKEMEPKLAYSIAKGSARSIKKGMKREKSPLEDLGKDSSFKRRIANYTKRLTERKKVK